MKRRTEQKKPLNLRRETLRQLDPTDLQQVAGGARRQPVYFDMEAYLRYCNGTVYP